MSYKAYLWGMRIVALLAFACTIGLIIFTSPYQNQDPNQKSVMNIVLFDFSLFMTLSGIFSIFLFWLRRKASGADMVYTHLGVSLRQGILVALSVVAILLLQSFRVLTWWDGLLAIGAVMMVELYFLAR